MNSNKDDYRTIRYMNAKIIKDYVLNNTYEFDSSIETKLRNISDSSMVGVRLKINSPIYIEKLIEIGKEDLSELTIDLE
ncbi:MAG: hypothetical protein PHX47_03495 [Candidatus ainarchaeum sp.]|nr:hypothetical protein [Candidatus ainarchaeum sp.]